MKRVKPTFLSVCAILSSVFVCVYYTVYLVLCLTGFDSKLMSFFALFVIACAVLPLLLRSRLKASLKKAYAPLKTVFAVIISLYSVSVMLFWCYIGGTSAHSPEVYSSKAVSAGDTGENTAVLVFGCRTYGYTPSRTLKLRLDSALVILNALPDADCIVSGGQGSNETLPEAEAMKAYLIDSGIDEQRIITESGSHSTSENIRYTKELIEKRGLVYRKIIGVSTDFHLPRIRLLSQRYGIQMDLCPAPSSDFGHLYVSMVREYLSYVKMLLFDKAVISSPSS